MERINERTKADVLLKFKWKSQIGYHEEIQFCQMNVWRDYDLFPEKLKNLIWGRKSGDTFKVPFKAGELIEYSDKNILELQKFQFQPPKNFRSSIKPHLGRFYPLGFFIGLAGVFPENMKPARVIEIKDNSIKIDTNIPIAKYDFEVEGFILDVRKKSADVGGECRDWCALAIESGPGMQVPFNGVETDFELDNPESFKREDETDDRVFYSEPRITSHIDSKCHENLVKLYDNILPKSGKILDLMSSYQSHIPEGKNYEVIGLGLNEEEMKQNKILNSFIVHDINAEPKLPFTSEEFDAVVCDLSIEYVTKPIDLIREVSRVLKKDGVLTLSFSNRYFPPKVVKIWIDLHEFERMGYVLELLKKAGGFKNFKTYSYRGFRRPYNDKYFGCTFLSDPLYVVYAERA